MKAGKGDSAPKVRAVHIEVPDAQRRLARAYDLILRAGVRQERRKKR